MRDLQLYLEISRLPISVKEQVLLFIKSLTFGTKEENKPAKKTPKAGCMKGTFSMGPDFNEPLEDFKDYME